MNNRGFAITTILFGITLLFCLLLVSLLGILSNYRGNLEKLVEGVNGSGGARNLIIKKPIEKDDTGSIFTSEEQITLYLLTHDNGLYCYNNGTNKVCKYYSKNGTN